MPTQIMAILNVTPDSFSDGGSLSGIDEVLRAAEAALEAGADILDIGGESTRPGAAEISVEEELRRVMPVIEAIRKRLPEARLSIDTRKAAVAEAAVKAGASIINDVSGLQFEPEIANVAAQHDAQLVITHSQGTPETMQRDPQYSQGVLTEVATFFERQIRTAEQAGVRRERLILDPGFGFGKTLRHNLQLLHYIDTFRQFNLPILAGTSRKGFLAMGDGAISPAQRDYLTAASLACAIQGGASIVRIHNVAALAPVVRLLDALRDCDSPED